MLNYEELEEILEEVTAKITLANRLGELEALLKSRGLERLISKQAFYETNKTGKLYLKYIVNTPCTQKRIFTEFSLYPLTKGENQV